MSDQPIGPVTVHVHYEAECCPNGKGICRPADDPPEQSIARAFGSMLESMQRDGVVAEGGGNAIDGYVVNYRIHDHQHTIRFSLGGPQCNVPQTHDHAPHNDRFSEAPAAMQGFCKLVLRGKTSVLLVEPMSPEESAKGLVYLVAYTSGHTGAMGPLPIAKAEWLAKQLVLGAALGESLFGDPGAMWSGDEVIDELIRRLFD